jgi:hypothetical protein
LKNAPKRCNRSDLRLRRKGLRLDQIFDGR